jgi:hypothetical protein
MCGQVSAAIPQVLDWQWTPLGAYPAQAGAAASSKHARTPDQTEPP